MEASGFRDAYEKFQKRRVAVLGVSPDAPAAQKKFQQKFSLPFPLLCDTEKKVAGDYGAWKEKSLYGRKVMGIERTTFLIGPDGRIARVFPKVKADGHAQEVLGALEN